MFRLEFWTNQRKLQSLEMQKLTRQIQTTFQLLCLVSMIFYPSFPNIPFVGTIVKIIKNEGDSVVAGEKVATLSAMKMETVVSAPKNGKIKRIYLKEGQMVEAGDLIIEIQ